MLLWPLFSVSPQYAEEVPQRAGWNVVTLQGQLTKKSSPALDLLWWGLEKTNIHIPYQ